jgi:hypothetical protein
MNTITIRITVSAYGIKAAVPSPEQTQASRLAVCDTAVGVSKASAGMPFRLAQVVRLGVCPDELLPGGIIVGLTSEHVDPLVHGDVIVMHIDVLSNLSVRIVQ